MPRSQCGSILPCLPVNERKPIKVLQVPARGQEVGHHLGPPVPTEPSGPPRLAPTARGHGLSVPVACTAPWHSQSHLIPGRQACDRPSPGSPQLNPANVSSSAVLARHGAAVPLPGGAVVQIIPASRSEPPQSQSHLRHDMVTARAVRPPQHPVKLSDHQLGSLPAWHGAQFNKLSIYFSRMTPSPPYQ